MGLWNATILAPPSGEVSGGWNDSIDTNNDLLLTHNPVGGFDSWTDTTQNSGSQDLMAITLDLNDSLDLNNNGSFDAGTESLLLTATSVSAFEATLTTLSFRTGTMNTYAVIPEPGTLGLLAVALAALGLSAGWRRRTGHLRGDASLQNARAVSGPLPWLSHCGRCRVSHGLR